MAYQILDLILYSVIKRHVQLVYSPKNGAEWDKYLYTGDLLTIERMVPSVSHALHDIQAMATPLCWEAWARELRSHPNKTYAAFIVRGLKNEVKIGFDYSSNSCTTT